MALVISRKLNGKTYLTVAPSAVPTEIEVVVGDIDREKVRLLFIAERSQVLIERQEVREARLASLEAAK